MGVIEKIFNCMEPNIRKRLTEYPAKRKFIEPVDFQKYYVIIKMTDYQFMDPCNSSYDGGNFHSEGLDEDNIASAALYYFDISENVNGGGLTFRGEMHRELSLTISDNDCVFFTNSKAYKHKVDKMNVLNENGNEKELYKDKNNKKVFGTRKLLGFFIVDPSEYQLNDVLVNLEHNILVIVNYWMIQCELIRNDDVANMIRFFIIGLQNDYDVMKHIKIKTDENRRKRYKFEKKPEIADQIQSIF